jgi:hypothetical protein
MIAASPAAKQLLARIERFAKTLFIVSSVTSVMNVTADAAQASIVDAALCMRVQHARLSETAVAS